MKNYKYASIIAGCVILVGVLIAIANYGFKGKSNENDKLEKLVLNEVVHSVFYAPQYVAQEKGFFKEEGLELEIITGNGADKSMTALLTKEADIILAGAESSMYVQVGENGKDIVNIGQLTKRAGNFLVAKENTDSFTWDDLRGKKVIGGRPGGMPEIVFENILKEKGIDKVKDVEIITNLDFTATAGAFSTGDYDYTIEFEPNASKLEMEGYGTVVASLGIDGGEIPYTSYITTKTYANENSDKIERFLRAIYRAQIYVEESSSREIATIISPQFEGVSLEQLEIIIERYKGQDTWSKDLTCDLSAYEKLESILIEANTLTGEVDLDKLIDNSFAKKVVGE